jgi:hypothetical protein
MTARSSHDPVHRLATALVLLALLGTLLGMAGYLLAGPLPQSPHHAVQPPANGYDPSDIIGPSYPLGPEFPEEMCQLFFPFNPSGPTLPPCSK